MFFGHVYHFFLVTLFGAGSIYPIYHVFLTCIPLFFSLLSLEQALSTLSTIFLDMYTTFFAFSLWSRLYLPYLPCFLDMYTTFLACSLWNRLYVPYLPCFSDMHTTFFCLALFGAGSIYPIYHVYPHTPSPLTQQPPP